MSLFSEIEISGSHDYMEYVDKLAKINTFKNKIYVGYVYTVDPVSKSVVLLKHGIDNIEKIFIIPGSSVTSIEILEDTKTVRDKHQSLFEDKTQIDETASKCQLKKTLDLLRINFVDCEYDELENVIKVADVLKIVSPFTVECCFSDNSIVLDKIKDILC